MRDHFDHRFVWHETPPLDYNYRVSWSLLLSTARRRPGETQNTWKLFRQSVMKSPATSASATKEVIPRPHRELRRRWSPLSLADGILHQPCYRGPSFCAPRRWDVASGKQFDLYEKSMDTQSTSDARARPVWSTTTGKRSNVCHGLYIRACCRRSTSASGVYVLTKLCRRLTSHSIAVPVFPCSFALGLNS